MAKTIRSWKNYQQEDDYDGDFIHKQNNRSNRLRTRQTLRTIDLSDLDSIENLYE